MEQLQVRPLQASDFKAVRQLHRFSKVQGYLVFASRLAEISTLIDNSSDDPSHLHYVAVDHDGVAGAVLCTLNLPAPCSPPSLADTEATIRPALLILHTVVVRADCRRKGVGRQLIQAVFHAAISRLDAGAQLATLECRVTVPSTAAGSLPFFQRLGYRDVLWPVSSSASDRSSRCLVMCIGTNGLGLALHSKITHPTQPDIATAHSLVQTLPQDQPSRHKLTDQASCQVTVRPLNASDEQAAWRLHKTAKVDGKAVFGKNQTGVQEMLSFACQYGSGMVGLAAVDANQSLCGVATAELGQPQECTANNCVSGNCRMVLLTVVTRADMRGCGVGRLLLEHLTAQADNLGCSLLVTDVAQNNQAAVDFFLSLGWQLQRTVAGMHELELLINRADSSRDLCALGTINSSKRPKGFLGNCLPAGRTGHVATGYFHVGRVSARPPRHCMGQVVRLRGVSAPRLRALQLG